VISLILVVLSIIIPLGSAPKAVGGKLVLGGTAYFFLIGIGFMVVEISLLQRMSVFLGHPIYSLSVVLFSLILTTGLGSLLSDRFQLDSAVKFVIWSGLTAGYLISLPYWLSGTLLAYDSAGLSKGVHCA
jgi:predicted membrane-bound spermidine synthase